MGFFDSLGSALGSAVGHATKAMQEVEDWKERLRGTSPGELKDIAQRGSPVSKKMGAALLLKEMGYGN